MRPNYGELSENVGNTFGRLTLFDTMGGGGGRPGTITILGLIGGKVQGGVTSRREPSASLTLCTWDMIPGGDAAPK